MQKNVLNQIGLRYGIMAIAYLVLQLLALSLLMSLAPAFSEAHPALVSYLSLIIGFYLLSFPLLILMLRPIPAVAPAREALGFGEFVKGIFMGAGICAIGSVIGTVLHTTLIGLTGQEAPGVSNLMLMGDDWANILTAGILAPIVEELIFRKLLVDRVAPRYGSTMAILLSGLMFGLFHGNLQQCFFAFGLGCFFAGIYLKTGNILYTIFYHMIINLSTSGVTVVLMKRALENPVMQQLMNGTLTDAELLLDLNGSVLAYCGWVIFLGLFAMVGIAFLLLELNERQKQKKALRKSLEEAAGEGSALSAADAEAVLKEHSAGAELKRILKSPGMWFFIAVMLALFVINYV